MSLPAICHPDRPRFCRGLCSGCHSRHRRAGTLDQFPPLPYGRPVVCVNVAEDAAWVLECDCRCHREGPKLVHGNGRGCPCGGQRAMAERLGIDPKTLARSLWRARKRGVYVA